MSDMQQFKCPCCGGTVVFSSQVQSLKCEYCESEFDINKLDELKDVVAEENVTKDADWGEYKEENLDGMSSYSCSSCGANVVVDANTVATECVYCGNKIVIQANATGVAKPDCVIPFALDKDYAVAELKKFYKGKFLLPAAFTAENRIEKITGLYVPFWLYDCDVNASLVFSAQKSKSWTSGNRRYTKTDYYKIKRAGDLGFNSIPVDASSSMDNKYMDSIEPYALEKLVDFNSAYLAGFQADKYDEDSKQCMERANERIRASVIEEFQNTLDSDYESISLDSSSIDLKHGDIRYAFLPIWILNTKYKDEIYTFAINAQTGKVVGSLPVSRGKFFALWLASSGIIYLIIFLINLFLN